MLNNYFYCKFIFLLSVFVQINVAVPRLPIPRLDKADQSSEDTALPEDFMRFLRSLEPSRNEITTRHVKTSAKQRVDTMNEEDKTTRLTSISTRKAAHEKEIRLNNQKEAFQDVLMLKLISYYEDKYRISRHDSSILPISELVEMSTPRYNHQPTRDETMLDIRTKQSRIPGLGEQSVPEALVI